MVIGGCQGLAEGKWDKLPNGYAHGGYGFSFAVTKMFWNEIEMVAAQHCECTKCY